MDGIVVKQELEVSVEAVLERAMILYSYDLFALLIKEVVNKSDEPERLAEIIKRHLTTAST